MRIIAGEFRGRKLLPPEGDVTRPITDRVKQSLFDVLTPLLDGAMVYDCFCGTGSMGLECLSRGSVRAIFFDADRSAVALLRRNIEVLNVTSRSAIIAGDLFRWAATAPPPAHRADLIFFDPPYRFLLENAAPLRKLAGQLLHHHLAPGGTLIFRHDAADVLDLPGLKGYDKREYGGMTVEFLSPANASPA